ncbi:hypothetical protein JXO59_15400 [candidate division KSB1 bacterium]|nr:hypothetical protein [candidate division KSB1 bacterium]
MLGNYSTKPAEVIRLKDKKGHWAQIKISEGKNRQVRRMFASMRYSVNRLIRTRIGELTLTRLPVGRWRYLTPEEVGQIQKR